MATIKSIMMIKNSVRIGQDRCMHIAVLALLILLTCSANATTAEVFEKQKLKELIDNRKKNFNEYFNSIEKRSGIFGNKTKKDLSKSNEILTSIVRTDNQIIEVLNRSLEYKTFEKTGFSYDKLASDTKIEQLLQANDTLSRQRILLKSDLNTNAKSLLFWKWLVYLFGTTILLQHFYFKKKLRKEEV